MVESYRPESSQTRIGSTFWLKSNTL
jgi:hypothetical protein